LRAPVRKKQRNEPSRQESAPMEVGSGANDTHPDSVFEELNDKDSIGYESSGDD